jgi:hypothetical protein
MQGDSNPQHVKYSIKMDDVSQKSNSIQCPGSIRTSGCLPDLTGRALLNNSSPSTSQ